MCSPFGKISKQKSFNPLPKKHTTQFCSIEQSAAFLSVWRIFIKFFLILKIKFKLKCMYTNFSCIMSEFDRLEIAHFYIKLG